HPELRLEGSQHRVGQVLRPVEDVEHPLAAAGGTTARAATAAGRQQQGGRQQRDHWERRRPAQPSSLHAPSPPIRSGSSGSPRPAAPAAGLTWFTPHRRTQSARISTPAVTTRISVDSALISGDTPSLTAEKM